MGKAVVVVRRACVLACVLSASVCVIGSSAASAATFTFQSPAGAVGAATEIYTSGGLQITAAGFNSSNFSSPDQNLFDKTGTGDEHGLGLTNDGDDEITVGSYVRIAMPAGVSNVTFSMDSSTTPDAWAVYGSSSADPLSLGVALATGTSEGTFTLPFEAYYFFTATDGNVLIDSLTMTATPLPAALPLFATGLAGLGLFGWRRKRKNSAAIAAA